MSNNFLIIDNVPAVVTYDPELEMLRGEFVGLNGGADFYANDVEGLKHEGKISLDIFVEACKEDGVTPFRIYSGKFQVRVGSKTHKSITMAAKKSGRSINSWVVEALEKEAAEELGEPTTNGLKVLRL